MKKIKVKVKKIKVKYEGVHPKGTIKPRRMWYPGDRMKLPIDVAQEVLKESGFIWVKVKRRKTKKKTKSIAMVKGESS